LFYRSQTFLFSFCNSGKEEYKVIFTVYLSVAAAAAAATAAAAHFTVLCQQYTPHLMEGSFPVKADG
jgi:hypothetical protein